MASQVSPSPSARVGQPPLGPSPSAPPNRPGLTARSVAVQLRRLYRTELREHEKLWRDRYSFLLKRGLELRYRYRPGWKPSWLDIDIDPAYCDDSMAQSLPMVLDAKRVADGTIVCIKRIEAAEKTDEVMIGQYLSTDRMRQDQNNHCVPIWDAFKDPFLPQVEYIVMPILRPFNKPEFGAIGEVVDFTTQLLEGMEFMHRYLVAHGDLTTQNIMMDARPILPNGWHFTANNFAPNGVDRLAPLARIDHPVRYIIVDFDCSVRLRPGEPHIINGFGGRDGEVPELTPHQPYDPFKMDVFTLGNVFFRDFYQKYEGLDFMSSIIDFMKTRDFHERPTAQVALQYWYNIRAHLDVAIARWRLRKRDESLGERVVLDTVAAARYSIHNMKRFLGGEESKAQWTNK